MTNRKFAAITIHCNGTMRISPFFNTIEECEKEYPNADAITPYANWKEHEEWSRNREGCYKYNQIEA